jgi:hypothetical protein
MSEREEEETDPVLVSVTDPASRKAPLGGTDVSLLSTPWRAPSAKAAIIFSSNVDEPSASRRRKTVVWSEDEEDEEGEEEVEEE